MIDGLLARLRSAMSDSITGIVGRNEAGEWGVVLFHGGARTHWLSPNQARKDALKLLDLANLACRPGRCPEDEGEGFGEYPRSRTGG